MKRFLKLVPIFLSVIGLVVLAGLIFYPNFKKEEVASNDVFAENISIDVVSRSISMDIDSTLHFTDTPYTVTPADCNQEVNVKILDNLGKDKTGAEYSNGYFKASELGTYYLRFFVANAYNGYTHDSIKINVYDEDNRIKQIDVDKYSASIYESETVDLNAMIDFVNTENVTTLFRYNGQVIPDGIFSSTAGTYEIEAIISLDGFEYIRSLQVVVKDRPKATLALKDINGNNIETNSNITCNLEDSTIMLELSGMSLNQDVVVNSSNNNVVSLSNITSPYIILNMNNVGNATVSIQVENTTFLINFEIVSKSSDTSLKTENISNKPIENNDADTDDSTDSSVNEHLENKDTPSDENDSVNKPYLTLINGEVKLVDKQIVKVNLIDSNSTFTIDSNLSANNISVGLIDETIATCTFDHPNLTINFVKSGTTEIIISDCNENVLITIYLEIIEEEKRPIDIEIRDIYSNLIVDKQEITVKLSDVKLFLSVNSLYSSSQSLNIISSNENIVSVGYSFMPILSLNLNNVGRVSLVIQNPSTSTGITLYINVVN